MNIDLREQEAYEFLKTLEKNSVDLILTDPPYEISRQSGYIDSLTKPDGTPQSERTLRRFAVDLDFGDWDKQNIDLLPFLEEMYRVLKPSGTLIMFYDMWKIGTLKSMMEASKFKQARFLEWVKTNPVPLNSGTNYLTNSREVAVTVVKKSKPTFNSKYDNGIYQYPIYHGKDRFHPTQKPLKLFEELIEKHSNEGDTVVDCFLGSGTTAVAALNTKRNFIGCEIDNGTYIKMKERVEKYEDEQNKE
jgi:site-specific DNA-methyltransferase (adenine-specific)